MKTVCISVILVLAAGFFNISGGQSASGKLVISGYVTDAEFNPVPGAFIMIDGSASDYYTDENGFYKVRITRRNESIGVCSFTFGLIEEIINGRKRVNFRFSNAGQRQLSQTKQAEAEDDDKINTGYTSVSRRDLLTPISQVDGRERRFAAAGSVYEMLAGSVPGVQVSGESVLIRGFTSLFGSNEPLFVVDGVPVSSVKDISPQMVKSIEVLKGSAAAIYGSRGSNGVILVDLIDASYMKSESSVSGIKIPFTDSQPATELKRALPVAMTMPADSITPETAQLNGIVNSNGLPSVVVFEYGPDTSYGSSITAPQSPVTGITALSVHANITGLTAGEEYHYRIAVSNELDTVYGNDKVFRAQYEPGQLIHGGYIFYVDETGKHGLICSPSDLEKEAFWGSCIPQGATGKATGTGYQNTEDIVNSCPDPSTAARVCHNLSTNGYDDWFLPSVNELYLIYVNLHEKGLGGFRKSYYWSSTQDKHGAWVVNFFYGSKSNQSRDKTGVLTRPIRRF